MGIYYRTNLILSIETYLTCTNLLRDFKLFMFSYYEETSTGFKAGGSVISFIIGIICSCSIIDYYQKKAI